jgi:hypothetical protein
VGEDEALGILTSVIWSTSSTAPCCFRSTAVGCERAAPQLPPTGPRVLHSSFNSQMEARAVGHFSVCRGRVGEVARTVG